MPYKDKQKNLDCRKRWYYKNKDKELKTRKIRKNKIRKWVQEYKQSRGCSKCLEKHPACLDFHHKEKKEKEIAFMVANGLAIKSIEKEITKCEILCSNCHRKLHSNYNSG